MERGVSPSPGDPWGADPAGRIGVALRTRDRVLPAARPRGAHGELLNALLDVELVALRIQHVHEILPALFQRPDLPRLQRNQPFHLGVDPAASPPGRRGPRPANVPAGV